MTRFSQNLLAWFEQNGRKNLPWQSPPTPYRVWVSEIMLQQTQVQTVIPYYERFLQRFPDVEALARATLDEVLRLWSGLGYYARARNLHKAAKQICDRFDGRFPESLEQLQALPGVGRSTAGAILALAMQKRQPILDGNVKRVLTRYHAIEGWPGKASIEKQLWQLADWHTPEENVSAYTQAIMDLGAILCTRKLPDCDRCPVSDECEARRMGRQSAFPTPRPKKDLPVKKKRFLILSHPVGGILLEKRASSGIWGGLWSLPECDHGIDLYHFCRERFGCAIESCEELDMVRHTFSHFRLEITPVKLKIKAMPASIRDEERFRWIDKEQQEPLGMATPVIRILKSL